MSATAIRGPVSHLAWLPERAGGSGHRVRQGHPRSDGANRRFAASWLRHVRHQKLRSRACTQAAANEVGPLPMKNRSPRTPAAFRTLGDQPPPAPGRRVDTGGGGALLATLRLDWRSLAIRKAALDKVS